MTLRIGNKKVCPTKLVLPNTQNITITQNGTYTPDTGYTGFSTVEVDVAGGTTVVETPNFTVVGTPEISGKVARGFTSSSYLTFTLSNVPSTITDYELIARVNTKQNGNYPQGLSAVFQNSKAGHCIGTLAGNTFSQWSTDSGDKAILSHVNQITVQQSTSTTRGVVGNYYWFKYSNGTAYVLFDDGSYTIDTLPSTGWTASSTSPTFGGVDGTFFENGTTYYIGKNADSNYPNQVWNGEFDLSNFRIKINGDIVFTPYTLTIQ